MHSKAWGRCPTVPFRNYLWPPEPCLRKPSGNRLSRSDSNERGVNALISRKHRFCEFPADWWLENRTSVVLTGLRDSCFRLPSDESLGYSQSSRPGREDRCVSPAKRPVEYASERDVIISGFQANRRRCRPQMCAGQCNRSGHWIDMRRTIRGLDAPRCNTVRGPARGQTCSAKPEQKIGAG